MNSTVDFTGNIVISSIGNFTCDAPENEIPTNETIAFLTITTTVDDSIIFNNSTVLKTGQQLTIIVIANTIEGSNTATLTREDTTNRRLLGISSIIFQTIGGSVTLLYTGSTYGWAVLNYHNVTVTLGTPN